MAVEQPRTLTADYAALPDDGRRYELIDGELFEMAAPSTRHQDIVLRLGWAFHDHVRRHGGGRVYVAPCDVVLSDTVTVQPDVVYLADGDADRVEVYRLVGAAYAKPEVLELGEQLVTGLVPGLTIDLADLLAL